MPPQDSAYRRARSASVSASASPSDPDPDPDEDDDSQSRPGSSSERSLWSASRGRRGPAQRRGRHCAPGRIPTGRGAAANTAVRANTRVPGLAAAGKSSSWKREFGLATGRWAQRRLAVTAAAPRGIVAPLRTPGLPRRPFLSPGFWVNPAKMYSVNCKLNRYVSGLCTGRFNFSRCRTPRTICRRSPRGRAKRNGFDFFRLPFLQRLPPCHQNFILIGCTRHLNLARGYIPFAVVVGFSRTGNGHKPSVITPSHEPICISLGRVRSSHSLGRPCYLMIEDE